MKCRILAVEDSATQAEALRLLLEEHHEVVIARSGEEALERIAADAFDLVVSDVMMGGISGYEFCRRIKADPASRELPVILLTSLHDPMDIVRGLEAGADNYVTKPYDAEHLLARIRHVLDNRRLRRHPRSSMGVSISFLGNEFTITSDKEQILDLLLSSVEDVIRTNEALQRAKEEADQANRAKSDFLSRMSHELRTPLNAVLGFGQLLELSVTEPEDRESVREVLGAGKHLLDLVDEVLDISRIEAGRLAISLETVAVRPLIDEVVAMIRPLAAARRITVDIAPQDCDGHLRADRQRLKQVLLNLLSNAIKYNREGGRVGIACAVRPGGALRVGITDTGPGIAADDLPRLFEPFSRLSAHAELVPGTGLGLALSKRLAEAMDGEIGVDSAPGAGSTFWIELPHMDGPEEPAEPGREKPAGLQAEPAGTEADRTILYIEDNVSNVRLVERLLARRPHVRLLPSMHGRLGIELAMQHRPDLILLDLNLPDIAGTEVLQRLRAEPALRETPVVVLSADAVPEQIEQLRRRGATAYVTKPIDVAELLALIDESLAASGGS